MGQTGSSTVLSPTARSGSRPYLPQQIYATGDKVMECLLYKDVNRDVSFGAER